MKGPGQLSGIAMSYGMEDREFESRQEPRSFHFTDSSRTALGPTQPPIQRVTGAISLGVKRPGCEADHSHLVPMSRMCGAITLLPQYIFMAWCSVKAEEILHGSQQCGNFCAVIFVTSVRICNI
jgi:hypothetical protein